MRLPEAFLKSIRAWVYTTVADVIGLLLDTFDHLIPPLRRAAQALQPHAPALYAKVHAIEITLALITLALAVVGRCVPPVPLAVSLVLLVDMWLRH